MSGRDAGLRDARSSLLVRSTAEAAALLRAAGHLVPDRELRGPDDLAARLIAPGPQLSSVVKVPFLRAVLPAVIERLAPGALWFEIARTRGMDDVLRGEVAAGARQVVILGAGLDSRAYRMRAELAETAVFEVDHPATGAYKDERVRAVLGRPPGNVRYVRLDFALERLADALPAAGCDPAARSVVVWSGVAPYLEPAVVDETLGWMASQAPGSAIVFDYAWDGLADGDFDHLRGVRSLRRLVEAQGEPFRSGIPRGATRAFLAERGLELVEDIDVEEATRRYLTRADGTVAGRLWEFGGVALARVPA